MPGQRPGFRSQISRRKIRLLPHPAPRSHIHPSSLPGLSSLFTWSFFTSFDVVLHLRWSFVIKTWSPITWRFAPKPFGMFTAFLSTFFTLKMIYSSILHLKNDPWLLISLKNINRSSNSYILICRIWVLLCWPVLVLQIRVILHVQRIRFIFQRLEYLYQTGSKSMIAAER